MVLVCLTCGSEGFPEWLVFCNKCQVYALHRYCFDGPTSFDDDVTWFCEDCEVEKPPSLQNSTSLPWRKSHDWKLENDTIPAYLKFKNHVKRVKKNYRKRQKIVKKQRELKQDSGCLDQPKVALSNYSNSTSDDHQNHSNRLSNNINKVKKKCMKKRMGTADIAGYISTRQESSPNCHFSNHNQIQCTEPCDQTPCSNNFEDTADSNKVSDTVQNSGASLDDTLSINKMDYWTDAQPVAQPIWRGSFFICSRGINSTVRGLVAHASTLACSKVLDETKLFPEVLCADVVNRFAVWPKGFKDLGPTTESIALYIFPETERDEIFFDKLVNDIVFLDLAIRVQVVNAEFLVFPSTVLPTQSWSELHLLRFFSGLNAKYYLWGVFRTKQASKTN